MKLQIEKIVKYICKKKKKNAAIKIETAQMR